MSLLFKPFILVFAILGAGCASNTVEPEEFSGFLSDYSNLEQVETPSGTETLRWISEKVADNKYSSVMLDKTIFLPKPETTEQISQAVLDEFSASVDKLLKDSAQSSLTITNQPGDGVLHLKAAITAFSNSVEGFQPIEVLPIALVLGAGKLAAGTRDHDVNVYLEVAISDSKTGELLATGVRKGQGSQLENDDEKLTMTHLEDMVATWEQDATAMFQELAK